MRAWRLRDACCGRVLQFAGLGGPEELPCCPLAVIAVAPGQGTDQDRQRSV